MTQSDPYYSVPKLSGSTVWQVVLLLALLAGQAVFSMRQKSVTVDEIMYIAAGHYHLRTGDFRMNMTNPPLMKVLSALPLLPLKLKIPQFREAPKDWTLIEQWQYARAFLYDNVADADQVLFLSRLPIVVLSLVLGLFVFQWARELYGNGAGLFSLFLYCLSPNILAHTRFATQDIGLAATSFISCYFFWRFLNRPTLMFVVLWGVFLGLALLTKVTALFLWPVQAMFAAICLFRSERLGVWEVLPLARCMGHPRLKQIASLAAAFLVVGTLSVIVLNAGYGFQGTLGPSTESPLRHTVIRAFSKLPVEVPIPLPWPYLKLLDFQFKLKTISGGVYFAGKLYSPGLWYLMIVSFLIKTPIPMLILSAVSAVFVVFQARRCICEWFMVLFIAFFFLLFSYFNNISGNIRYILLVYPFLFILTSRLISLQWKRKQLVHGFLIGLSAWYVIGAVIVYPHYLAYFNEFIGGPTNGYKYLADSNLDWGQDLKLLKRYMEENKIERIKLAYFGSADANYYGIDYDYLPSVGLAPKKPGQYWWYEVDSEEKKRLQPQKGVLAVSANILASPQWMDSLFRESYGWLKKYEPVDQVGYSILIYNIR